MKLNTMQQLAVDTPSLSTLVLAGAGTGKTKTLVSRIAKYISDGIPIPNILAVTFTNKAANEIRERLEHQLNLSVSQLWIGTFHSLAFRMLLTSNKQKCKVLSQTAQLSVVKNLLAEHKLTIDPQKAVGHINSQKDSGKRSTEYSEGMYQQCYHLYEQHCCRHSLYDFGELLLVCYETLRDHETVRQHYQQRFNKVLVDEFQDTNLIQYEWLRLLTQEKQNIFAVGDDDQSIYAWRGARPENIIEFQRQYPTHHLIKLEENYRCTKTILGAANAVIRHNTVRMSKTLFTNNQEGEPLLYYPAHNDKTEAQFIASQIGEWQSQGKSLDEIAVLYRRNAQSELIAETLWQAGVPYDLTRGTRFFDRQEIRIVLSYLQLVCDLHDPIAFEYVLNTPPRGLGTSAKQVILNHASRNKCSYWESSQMLVKAKYFHLRAHKGLESFLSLLSELQQESLSLSLPSLLTLIIEHIGLFKLYESDEERIEHLSTLIELAEGFTADTSLTLSPGEQFLSQACLHHDEDQKGKGVKCMTVHAAKGLEFELVFIAGLEEKLFPALYSPLEEERRLFYVALTRAKEKLVLTSAKQRTLFGQTVFTTPSRFIREIPVQYLRTVTDTPSLERLKQQIPTLSVAMA